MLTIVFDGYSGGPSTKDHEHSRRGSSTCPDFNIKRETLCTVTQQSFLTNSNNKTGLLAILIPQLIEDGHTVKQAVSDADRLIVRTAVQAASDGRSVTVFANDTDVITMLLHHWEEHMSSIVVRSEFKSKGNTVWKQLDIREASLFLNPEVKKFVLFIHAFGGCDTTSGIHEKGKGTVAKLIEKSDNAKKIAKVFSNGNPSQEEIGIAGNDLFVLLYGGKIYAIEVI